MNGWIKALVSADPFCRLQTRTSNRQLNGHDHGKAPAPTARAEVWGEVCLPARPTPPAEECTGAFRSFCPNCCMVRSVGRDRAAVTQGGRRSKRWPQDRLSWGMGRGWRDSSRSFTTDLWAPLSPSNIVRNEDGTAQPGKENYNDGLRASEGPRKRA